MSNISQQYADNLSNALARITKTPALATGILEDAANVIAREGCNALRAHRVGIWRINAEKTALSCVASYDRISDTLSIQGEFNLTQRQKYLSLLNTERLIVISNSKTSSVLPNLQETYPSKDYEAI